MSYHTFKYKKKMQRLLLIYQRIWQKSGMCGRRNIYCFAMFPKNGTDCENR